MQTDIGASRPINGNQIFLVGHCLLAPSESPFVLLYDAAKGREIKRNLRGIDPEKLVLSLGGVSSFNFDSHPFVGEGLVSSI